ncbi:MAG: helix-turn-helix domain-containing protein [Bifidobacteriaceae bacterium]|nr:helix-turn-helix domain-containing protein [Bifidobacteriaceae bacterium]
MQHLGRLWLSTSRPERGCTSLARHYKHLSLDERIQIEKHHDQGRSARWLAMRLAISPVLPCFEA